SLLFRRNSIPPNLWGSDVTSVQLSISFAILSVIVPIDIILLIYIYKVLGLQTIQIIFVYQFRRHWGKVGLQLHRIRGHIYITLYVKWLLKQENIRYCQPHILQ